MSKFHVIVHPSDMAQSDWVRLILPMMEFMRANEFQVFPSISHMTCTSREALKKVRSVIIPRPTASGKMEAVMMYAKLKKECGFKLVTDIDDLQWDLSPIIKADAKGLGDVEGIVAGRYKQILPLFDTVVCSTRYLANRIKSDLGVNAVVSPNGVSKSLFGAHKTTSSFQGVPKVMYAGALGHCTPDNLGDFEGPWVPWLRKRIEEGTIDFYVFGTPSFLEGLEGKYTTIPYTSVMQFPSVAASYRPDFYLAPLTNINFNKAKSDLKLKEAAALGAVFLGSDFAGSPYGYIPKEQLVNQSGTDEELDAKFNALCNPENYMKAIEWQYQSMEEKHWLYEDPEFQKRYVNTYC
ncbi:MAG: hypothetical protein K6E57_02285 [Fibrobacter sp.]|nr:hypothetical protein [Fibrobacter sp.]